MLSYEIATCSASPTSLLHTRYSTNSSSPDDASGLATTATKECRSLYEKKTARVGLACFFTLCTTDQCILLLVLNQQVLVALLCAAGAQCPKIRGWMRE